MDLRVLPGLGPGAAGVAQAGRPVAAKPGASFANALDSALQSVSRSQEQASELQRKFQLGADSVSLEETMVAMQKAQIGFQAAVTVRNRLVSAYTDIMNMQV